MMNRKLTLVLAAALLLGMTACSKKQENNAAADAGSVDAGPSSAVVIEVPQDPTVTEEILNQPAEMPDPNQPIEPMPMLPAEPAPEDNQPAASEKPSELPEQKPIEAPAPSGDISMDDLAAAIEAEMGELPGMFDLIGEDLTSLYGMDESLLESYICRVPMMNVQSTEYFVAKVKDGNMDAVKASLADRLQSLDDIWSHYLPDQYEFVKNAKTVVAGDYVLFIVSEFADNAVSAFTSALA